jgi:signal transduction histidine kinase
MNLLIEDLLTVTRLKVGVAELRLQPVDLALLMKEVLGHNAEVAERHTITFVPDGPLVVEADRELIALVLTRLLENALEAEPEGGPIELDARSEEGSALVSVVDHGAGIPPERQEHIFEPFYEAVPSGRPGYVGVVSLRLHLCKRILDAHGGRIWFTSSPDAGSTFTFSLPKA